MTLETMINGRHEAGERKTISKKNQIRHFRQGRMQELPKQKARPTKRSIEDTCSPIRNQKDSELSFLPGDRLKSVVPTRMSGQLSGQMFGPSRVFCGSHNHPSTRAQVQRLQLLCFARNNLLSSGLTFDGSIDQPIAATTLSQISSKITSCAELSVKPLEPREHTKQSSHAPGNIIDRVSCRARGMPADHHFEVSWEQMPVRYLTLPMHVVWCGTCRSRISSDNFLFVECPFHNHNRDEAWRGTTMFTPYLSSGWNQILLLCLLQNTRCKAQFPNSSSSLWGSSRGNSW